MAKKKITLNSVKALRPGDAIWDTELRGFGCRCQVGGKFFVLKYSLNGRQRFYTIGKWDSSLTPDQARKEAEILKGEVRKGQDVSSTKAAAKKIPIVKHAFAAYLVEIQAKKSPRTYAEYERLFNLFISPAIGNYNINAVTRADMAKIHSDLIETPYQANRVLAVSSSFFNWAEKSGHRTDGKNPCRHIEMYEEKARERFLSEAEIYRLGKALDAYEKDNKYLRPQPGQPKTTRKEINHVTPYVTAALRLLLLTGARRNEILSLKWADVDFQRKLIRLQESKTGQKTIYLSAPALKMLAELPRIEGNQYVICGRNTGDHLKNLVDSWSHIRKIAGLEGVRIHDLRHNYASTAVASGLHMKVIGSLLGHADTKTTERYAHLANDPLQTANETISKKILDAMTTKPDKVNVVSMTRNKPRK